MTPNQQLWIAAKKSLGRSAAELGYPEELADLLARELGGPKAIDRLASYMTIARPGSLEEIVDEMLAIRSQIEAWRVKKESRAAQAGYKSWLRSDERQECMNREKWR